MTHPLPLGKLPVDLLAGLLANNPIKDPRVRYGPGIGLDCAVIDLGERTLVLKSDPITFATDDIGWYAVQVNANDIATTGATPRWMLVTLLLPEAGTTAQLVNGIFDQVYRAAQELGISVIGGHTEITYDLRRPILAGTLIGEVDSDRLITPDGAQPGDILLLTKGVPIEATALLAREFGQQLVSGPENWSATELETARQFLYQPGISVVRDAQIAIRTGQVHAMHDPTEGGLAGALWELSDAAQRRLVVDRQAVPSPPLSRKICATFNLNPLATIASGALLMAVAPGDAAKIQAALVAEGIDCSAIGQIEDGAPGVWESDAQLLDRPARDEITKVYETQ